jgi:hypothetical protein
VIFTKPLRIPGQERVENGTPATVQSVEDERRVKIATRGAKQRELDVDTREFSDLRLAYAQHVYKAQGLTAERAHVLIGGWQTDRERAYVALTRARKQTNIYTSREDLGEQDINSDTIDRLAERISQSKAQQASINTPTADRSHERTETATERVLQHEVWIDAQLAREISRESNQERSRNASPDLGIE